MTEQETNVDNSMEIETQEPENAPDNTDNADTDNSQNEVNDKEPAETDGQFKDLEAANKAYAELRKLNGEQSTELGELRKMRDEIAAEREQRQAKALENAQNNGFNSVIEYENHNELVNFVADEYEKNLTECAYPDEVKNLIDQYRKTPNNDILKAIKSEFDVDTLEKVTLATKAKEDELQQKIFNEIEASARSFLNENVYKYADRFKNPAFAELYGEAFRAYGVNLDTEKFVNLMDQYGNFIAKTAGIANGINNDNKNATDEISGLTAMGGNAQNNGSEKDILSMSEAEMKREILSKI